MVLFLYDSSIGLNTQDKEIYEIIKNKPHITIANKIELTNDFTEELQNTVKISTYTKSGLENLKERIKEITCNFSSEDTEFITNKRQQSCLINCKQALLRALDAAKYEELQDMIYIDLKSALLALDEITGEVITDDILNNIFDHFCIGK